MITLKQFTKRLKRQVAAVARLKRKGHLGAARELAYRYETENMGTVIQFLLQATERHSGPQKKNNSGPSKAKKTKKGLTRKARSSKK